MNLPDLLSEAEAATGTLTQASITAAARDQAHREVFLATDVLTRRAVRTPEPDLLSDTLYDAICAALYKRTPP